MAVISRSQRPKTAATRRFAAIHWIFLPVLVCLLPACQTTGPDTERGPDRTVAAYLKVESSVPGIAVETNGVFAGKTPLTLRIFGDAGGTFHSFGSPEYTLRALPSTTNEFTQVKAFRAGTRSVPGEKIPGLIFFDMSQPEGTVLIDSIPERE